SYAGNGGVNAVTGSNQVWVTPMDTSTVVAANPTGTELTATVSGNAAAVDLSGTVTFDANGGPVSLCSALAVTDQHDGTATVTCPITPRPGDDVDYTATFSGNADAAGSTSAPLHLNVAKAVTTTAVELAGTALTYGQSASATATVRAS